MDVEAVTRGIDVGDRGDGSEDVVVDALSLALARSIEEWRTGDVADEALCEVGRLRRTPRLRRRPPPCYAKRSHERRWPYDSTLSDSFSPEERRLARMTGRRSVRRGGSSPGATRSEAHR